MAATPDASPGVSNQRPSQPSQQQQLQGAEGSNGQSSRTGAPHDVSVSESGPSRLDDSSQPVASSSKLSHAQQPFNPQLTDSPWFAYPTPSPEELDAELPPYFVGENIPLGELLERLARKGYGDMRGLVDRTAPKKPRPIIEYAKTTRHALLKYLAILRWKAAVDIVTAVPDATGSAPQGSGPQANGATHHFPTPLSLVDSAMNSPAMQNSATINGKGKGRATDASDVKPGGGTIVRGKVTDAKRIQQFMEHQNLQHDRAIDHVQHASRIVENFRVRNADLLTAVSLLSLGEYSRLPSNLTESFLSREPLTPALILDTLRRLDAHILYRLRCVDYVPPDLHIDRIANGRAYISGGRGVKADSSVAAWRAEVTVVGFSGEGEKSKWWLTGLEWCWRSRPSRGSGRTGDEEEGGGRDGRAVAPAGKKFEGDERQQILDMANVEVLPPRVVPKTEEDGVARRNTDGPPTIAAIPGSGPTASADISAGTDSSNAAAVDAPLVRLHNFLQYLSLSYQLETLLAQSLALANGKWRGQLLVEMDRAKKILRLKYWVPATPSTQPSQTSGGKRSQAQNQTQQASLGAARPPLIGGILSVSVEEQKDVPDRGEALLDHVRMAGLRSSERCLRLGLQVRWEIGEAGAGKGMKAGNAMDVSSLILDPASLDIEDILNPATRSHAILLTTSRTSALLASPRISLLSSRAPALLSNGDNSSVPLALSIPLPSRQRPVDLSIGISSLTGLVDIKDAGATEGDARFARAKAVATVINEKGRLTEEIGTMLAVLIAESVEMQMRLLGWTPIRRLPLRPQELAKTDLHPMTTVLVPIPSSPSTHYLSVKIGPTGLHFELIRLSKVASESGVGVKAVVADRMDLDLGKLRRRRDDGKKRQRDDDRLPSGPQEHLADGPEGPHSSFEISTRDLRELFIFSNALVSQTIIEQQLKDRSIPHTLQYPPSSGMGAPTSTASVAGIIPTIVVNTSDLLNDQRAGDVAMPRVYMQLKDWWLGDKCSVVTIVQLRHRSSLSDSASTPEVSTSARASKAAKAEGIEFDQASSIVKFTASDIAKCVPAFLEQWERLSKVIVVAGEVSRLARSDPSFRDVRMLSFDLRTATLVYAPGYLASITYTPQTDSYVVSFARAGLAQSGSLGVSPTARLGLTPGGGGGGGGSLGQTPNGITGSGSGLTPAAQTYMPSGGVAAGTPATPGMREGNPHEALAPTLSWRLNHLVKLRGSGNVGKEYIGLLRATLPLLLEIESIRNSTSFPAPAAGEYTYPTLVVSGVKDYRLVYDHQGKRFIMDCVLLAGNERFIITDGTRPRYGGVLLDCGPLEPIPDWENIVTRLFDAVKKEHKASGYPHGPDTPNNIKSPALHMTLTADTPAKKSMLVVTGENPRPPPLVRLDGGKSLMCEARLVGQLVRMACDDVERAIVAAAR